jgi:hypothetical protein
MVAIGTNGTAATGACQTRMSSAGPSLPSSFLLDSSDQETPSSPSSESVARKTEKCIEQQRQQQFERARVLLAQRSHRHSLSTIAEKSLSFPAVTLSSSPSYHLPKKRAVSSLVDLLAHQDEATSAFGDSRRRIRQCTATWEKNENNTNTNGDDSNDWGFFDSLPCQPLNTIGSSESSETDQVTCILAEWNLQS